MVMTRAFGRRALEAVKEELLNILRHVGQVGVGVKGPWKLWFVCYRAR